MQSSSLSSSSSSSSSVNEGSVDGADGAAAAVDDDISVGGELVVLVPIGGGVESARTFAASILLTTEWR